MRIAVDARPLRSDNPDLENLTCEVFTRLAIQHPEHTFIFFIDRKDLTLNNLSNNVLFVFVAPRPSSFLGYKWWYDAKLFFALKKHNADIFIATYGLVSLTTSIPQLPIISNLPISENKRYFPAGSYTFFKKYLLPFIKKSQVILTLTDHTKDVLVTNYNLQNKTLLNIGSGAANSYMVADWTERELIKEEFAEGFEYFLFDAGFHPSANLVKVLKAFSVFKKWQRSNMKLVITGSFNSHTEKELEKIASYKYRSEVFVKKNPGEKDRTRLIAGSYALIFLSYSGGSPSPLIHALYCQVPIVTARLNGAVEITEEAAIYINSITPEELAEQLKTIYKDEQVRNGLIEAAKQRAKKFSWDNTAKLVWSVIEEYV